VKKRVELSKPLLAAIIILVLAVGFVIGTRSNQLYAFVGPLFGTNVSADTIDLSSVQLTYQTLKANYNGKLDKTKLIEGANRGLVEAVGDKYTIFMNKKEAQSFEDDLSGNIGGGVGAEIGMRNKQPTVIRTLDGDPAQAAGVHAGDVIIAVNDQSVVGKDAQSVVDMIRGEIGTTVKITVRRGNETKTFSITREQITNPSVSSKVVNGVGILTLNRFDSDTAEQARAAAEKFAAQKVKGVVLDLRGNGGGYVEAAQGVAGLWLDNKEVVTIKSVGSSEQLNSKGEPILKGIPTVVLINGGSASASEIVAGALHDHGVAKLVGEKSFGKGTVQEILPLADDSKLKVTIKRWYTPNGVNITDHGIVPDKKIVLTQKNVEADKDPQLDAALSSLK